MNRNSFVGIAVALSLAFNVSVICATAQDKEKSEDTNHVKQAEEISALSGRPILAIAGSNT